MSSFTENEASSLVNYHPEASRLLGKHYWVTVKPFEYHVGKKDSEEVVKVPAGFLTSGDSLPALLWNLNTPWSSKGLATIMHDYLYEHRLVALRGIPIPIDERLVDIIFTQSLQVLGMPRYKVLITKGILCLARLWCYHPSRQNLTAKRLVEALIRQNLNETGSYSISTTQEEILIKNHPKFKEL